MGGIHVHEGTSCSDPQGRPLPWQPITYTSSATGVVNIPSLTVSTGLPLESSEGRVFVVHDSSGAKVACAKLKAPTTQQTLRVGAFDTYPGYEGDLTVTGVVDILQVGDSAQYLQYALVGADPECTSYEAFEGNACGIHIHVGTICADAGGHYYSGESDPWVDIRYVAPGFVGVTFSIATMLSDVAGRTVVVHDHDGARIACGVIEGPEPTPAPSFLGRAGSSPLTLLWSAGLVALLSARM